MRIFEHEERKDHEEPKPVLPLRHFAFLVFNAEGFRALAPKYGSSVDAVVCRMAFSVTKFDRSPTAITAVSQRAQSYDPEICVRAVTEFRSVGFVST